MPFKFKFPCFESQVTEKDPFFDEKAEEAFWKGNRLGISPTVAKAFYKEAQAHYDNGLDFQETLDKMHERSGLKKVTIAKILSANRSASKLSNEMWNQQANYRQIKTAAQIMVNEAGTPNWVKNANTIWDLSRRSATAFHGGVLPFTHARNLALQRPAEQKIWAGMVARAYKYMSPNKGRARWERDMEHMMATDEYQEAVRYGVEARPGDMPVGILANLSKGWGIRGFDALKPGRVELFHLWKNELGITDEGALKMLAKEVNYATGGIKLGKTATEVLPYFSFAPKLWLAKRMEAYAPIRYFAKAGRMSAEERMVANKSLSRWARNVITTASILGASDLFNKYVLKNNSRTNWDDFSSPGTLWRMNVGGRIIPISPLVEVIRAPVAAVAALTYFRRKLKGEAPLSAATEYLMRDIISSAHPSLIKGVELISGREVFGIPRHLRRLPSLPVPGTDRRFPGVAQLIRGEDPDLHERPMSWAEYIAEQGPIPLAAYAREVFSPALQEEGIPKPTADKWVEGLLNGALSGAAGVHTFEISPKAAPQSTRYHRPPGTLK